MAVVTVALGCTSCTLTLGQKVVHDVKEQSQTIDDDLRTELRKHRSLPDAVAEGTSALRNGGQVATMLVDQDLTKSRKVRYDLVLNSRRFSGSGDSYKSKSARLCMRLEGSIWAGRDR